MSEGAPKAASGGQEIVERLDRLMTLLEVALAPQLEQGREAVRKDPVDASILDLTAGKWIPTAKLQMQVEAKTETKDRTIRDHIKVLVERGFLQSQGGGRSTQYRSTGVI
jgi:Fic family protein